jgi:hypothetical protein
MRVVIAIHDLPVWTIPVAEAVVLRPPFQPMTWSTSATRRQERGDRGGRRSYRAAQCVGSGRSGAVDGCTARRSGSGRF